MGRLRVFVLLLAVAALFVSTALPVLAHEGGNDFVCPVFNDEAAVGGHNPNAVMLPSGEYTIAPEGANHLSVPDQATNMDGLGSPGGVHASPGDSDFSGIWNGD